MDDEVFRALNDASRRLLLDRLFERDGQILSELCESFPEMTRFGVMSHLRVLEEADLVTTRKSGRNKHHYLNPVPIRLVHDRWISKYTEPWAGGLARLKTVLEGEADMSAPSHIYQTYIRCPAEEAWNAIVDGDMTVKYYYGTRVYSDWTVGSSVEYLSGEGAVVADGEVLGFDPPRRLEMTFYPRWDNELEAEGPVRMVWSVEPADGLTRVTVEFYDMEPASRRFSDFTSGIPYIVSGMKTLLETGQPLAHAS